MCQWEQLPVQYGIVPYFSLTPPPPPPLFFLKVWNIFFSCSIFMPFRDVFSDIFRHFSIMKKKYKKYGFLPLPLPYGLFPLFFFNTSLGMYRMFILYTVYDQYSTVQYSTVVYCNVQQIYLEFSENPKTDPHTHKNSNQLGKFQKLKIDPHT